MNSPKLERLRTLGALDYQGYYREFTESGRNPRNGNARNASRMQHLSLRKVAAYEFLSAFANSPTLWPVNQRHFIMFKSWPDRVFLRRYVPRAALLWTTVHVVLGLLTRGEVIVLPTLAAGVLLLVVGSVGILDMRRRDEILFLQNLGVSRAIATTCWVAVPAVLEVTLAIVASNLGYVR